jgi:hypothetical protein
MRSAKSGHRTDEKADACDRHLPIAYHAPMREREYECCFCKKGIGPIDGHSHRMDPCALVIIGNWISPSEQQLSQQYFCHIECFKAQIGEKNPLYIEEIKPGDQA